MTGPERPIDPRATDPRATDVRPGWPAADAATEQIRIPDAAVAAPPPAGAPVLEPAPDPVAVSAVSPRRSRNGTRWGVALLVTAAVLGVTAAGLLLLSAGAATSALVSHVPADSYGYLEIRLDAPGDQRQNVSNVLSKFPGFADQANLALKIDEALDQALAGLGPNAGTFSRDIRPWLGDSIAVVATRLPSGSDLGASDGAGLVLVATKDPNAARTWVRTFLAPGTSTTTYAGVELSIVGAGDTQTLVGVAGNVLLGGDEQSVRDAIDTRGASTFADGATFKEATAAIAGDRLAYGYLDLRRLIVGVLAEGGQTPAPSGPLSLESLPSWLSVVVRAESDAVTATVAVSLASLSPTNANRSSGLAPNLPPETLAAIELHDLGDAILTAFNAFRESPQGREQAAQIDQALQALGGAEALVAWIGDGTIALVGNGAEVPEAGVLIRAKDAEEASNRLLQLRNLVSLLGGSSGITVTDEMHGDTSVAVYDFGAAAGVTGGAQLPIAVGDRLRLAIAQRDDLVIIGIGTAFVQAVLDTSGGESLAETDRYRTAINRAGASNAGQLYLDVPRLLELVVGQMSPEEQEFYRREIAPYLAPVQAFAAAASSGDRSRATFVVTVR